MIPNGETLVMIPNGETLVMIPNGETLVMLPRAAYRFSISQFDVHNVAYADAYARESVKRFVREIVKWKNEE